MSTDRHDPLDADERELARVLRALPAGEPPSTLDARILALARDAVVAVPEGGGRPPRAPRFAWGLGVAASCVMAAGLVWRMGGFGGESLDLVGGAVPEEAAVATAPAAAPAQPAPPMPEAQTEHISVEIGGSPSAPRPALVPPPPPPPETPARQRASLERLDALRAQAMEQRREQAPAVAAAPAPEPAPLAGAPDAMAPLPAPATNAGLAGSAESQHLDRVVVTGSRIDPDVVRPVAEDGKAGAQTWLRRIRARIAAGDEEGARESLEAFMARHPRKPLPQDLIDFRARSATE